MSDMSCRLREVTCISSTVVMTITDFGYKANLQHSLWRLKPETWLNDEVVNAYIELLQKYTVSSGEEIANTYTISDISRGWVQKLAAAGEHKIYLPINLGNFHWTFAVIESKSIEDDLVLMYYDSAGGGDVPEKVLK